MSADSHAVCPKCQPEILKYVGVMDNVADDVGLPKDVRENYEYYMTNAIIDGVAQPFVTCRYHAKCWTCGWEMSFEHREPLTGLEPKKDG